MPMDFKKGDRVELPSVNKWNGFKHRKNIVTGIVKDIDGERLFIRLSWHKHTCEFYLCEVQHCNKRNRYGK